MIVEASLSHPESVNRTNFDCVENGLPSVCMDLTLCFSYKGKEVPGYIGKDALTEFTLPERARHSFVSWCSSEPSLCLTLEASTPLCFISWVLTLFLTMSGAPWEAIVVWKL